MDQVYWIDPICSHFGQCGGCDSQDIAYSYELEKKEEDFRSAFSQYPVKIFDPICFDRPYEYRSRMDFLFHNHQLCQRLKGNFRVKIPLHQCHIAHPVIDILLKKINHWFQSHQEETQYLKNPENFNERTLKYVTIRKPMFTSDASVTFIVNQDSLHTSPFTTFLKKNLSSFLESLLPITPYILIGFVNSKQELSVSSNFQVLHGEAILTEKLMGNAFLFHTQGFFQNNSLMISKIIKTIKEWIEEYQIHHLYDLYDLYGGCGVMGISMAKGFKNIWVVDTEGINIELANTNLRNNDIGHGKVMMRNVKDFLDWEDYTQGMRNSIVIVDPPRSGLGGKVIRRLLKKKPRVLFYISCNHSVLAKEVLELTAGGYRLKKIAPFDLFPRTPHLEAVAWLTLDSR